MPRRNPSLWLLVLVQLYIGLWSGLVLLYIDHIVGVHVHPCMCVLSRARGCVLRSLHDEYGEKSILNTEYVHFQGQM